MLPWAHGPVVIVQKEHKGKPQPEWGGCAGVGKAREALHPAPPLGLGEGRRRKAGPWQFPGKAQGVSSAACPCSAALPLVYVNFSRK